MLVALSPKTAGGPRSARDFLRAGGAVAAQDWESQPSSTCQAAGGRTGATRCCGVGRGPDPDTVMRRAAIVRLVLGFGLALAFAAPAAAQTFTLTPDAIPESATTSVTYDISGFTQTGTAETWIACPQAAFQTPGLELAARLSIEIATDGTASGSLDVFAVGVDSDTECQLGTGFGGDGGQSATTTLTIENTDNTGSDQGNPQPQPTNAAPKVTIAAASTTVAPGGTVALTATAVDSDGTIAGYQWTAARGTFSTMTAAETV